MAANLATTEVIENSKEKALEIAKKF